MTQLSCPVKTFTREDSKLELDCSVTFTIHCSPAPSSWHCVTDFVLQNMSYQNFCELFVSVSKTNLSVHEDKNRVPYVKVGFILQTDCEFHLKLKLIMLAQTTYCKYSPVVVSSDMSYYYHRQIRRIMRLSCLFIYLFVCLCTE